MKSRIEFLQLLWSETINAAYGGSWIDNCIRSYEEDANSPFADVGQAMKHMRELGVSDSDINAVGRGACYDAVFDVLYKLGDPGVENADLLFEELLLADPSGREGRPKHEAGAD
jgi:hypothetical protein